MKDEFPEFVEEDANSIPPQIIQVMDRMFGGERTDSRELEWRNVMMPLAQPLGGESNIDNIRMAIEKALNAGFALNQKFLQKKNFFYWQGARLRKPEGE